VAGSQPVRSAEVDPEGGRPAGEHFDGEWVAGGEAGRLFARGFGEKFDEGAQRFAGQAEVVYAADVIEDLGHGTKIRIFNGCSQPSMTYRI